MKPDPASEAELRQIAVRGRALTVGDLERTLAQLHRFYRKTRRPEADPAQVVLECFQMATGLTVRPSDEILSPTTKEDDE